MNSIGNMPLAVSRDLSLTPMAKVFCAEIIDTLNEKGYSEITNPDAAEKFGTTSSAVSKWLRELSNAGYIRYMWSAKRAIYPLAGGSPSSGYGSYSPSERKKSNSKTRVYLMVDEHTGFYKIGRSKNPNTREKTLQSRIPLLKMIGHWPSVNKAEKELHRNYDSQRVRGEWFRLSRQDVVDIVEYLTLENKEK